MPPQAPSIPRPPAGDALDESKLRGPLSPQFAPLVLPQIGLPGPTPSPRVEVLHPTTVRRAVTDWMEGLPSRRLDAGDRLEKPHFSLLPTGLELLTRDVTFNLGEESSVRARGYITADWREDIERQLRPVTRFLPIGSEAAAPAYQGAIAEGRIWSPSFTFAVAAQDSGLVAGGLVLPSIGSLFGSVEKGRWQTIGEFHLDDAPEPFRLLTGAFAADPERQHLRLGLYTPGGRDLLAGCDLYRGPDAPGGTISGWAGGERAQVAFRYDLERERLHLSGHADAFDVNFRGVTVTTGGSFDTEAGSLGAMLRMVPSERSRFRGFGVLGVSTRPDGSIDVTGDVRLRY